MSKRQSDTPVTQKPRAAGAGKPVAAAQKPASAAAKPAAAAAKPAAAAKSAAPTASVKPAAAGKPAASGKSAAGPAGAGKSGAAAGGKSAVAAAKTSTASPKSSATSKASAAASPVLAEPAASVPAAPTASSAPPPAVPPPSATTPDVSPPAATPPAADGAGTADPGAGPAGAPGEDSEHAHKRPTRDSLQGERTPGSAGGRRRVVIDSQASRRAPGGGPGGQSNQPPRRQRRGRRRRGVYDEEAESRPASSRTALAEPNTIRINSGATVKDVAEYLDVRVPEIVKKLMELGEMKTQTQTLSDDTIQVLAVELGKEVEIVHSEDETVAEPVFDDAEEELVERAPVVTIMGHVDHGKTSLLDAIRSTEVAAGEAGGITQHIGAYQVHHGDRSVTFLDTPGHEAFTAMRARGAKVTDIAVIVVAADDGVKPQTTEAVDHAKEADVPMIVAVNKIDKEGADPARVRSEMTTLGLQPVEWGGDIDFVDVSARSKEGLDDLLDTIVAQAELMELRANPDAAASGTVIESKLDSGRGPVVTILIMRGTLEVGDALVAGAHWGRVRAMHDFLGNRVGQALPGEPVEVLGFEGVPEAGERVRAVDSDRRAKQLANERLNRLKTESLARRSGKRVSLEDIFKSGVQELNLVLKSDVAGSLEAIEDEIAKLPQDEVSVNVIRRAVGAVTESDVMLAAASDAVILAFNVRPVGDARSVAEREGRRDPALLGDLPGDRGAAKRDAGDARAGRGRGDARQRRGAPDLPRFEGRDDRRLARARRQDRSRQRVRLIRDGTVVYDGEIGSLRRFNEDAREVAAGFDCGIVLKDFADLKEGDILEAYTTRQVERELA